MLSIVSWRRWLLSATIAASLVSQLAAESPKPQIQLSIGSPLPVQSRSFRLTGDTDQPVVVTAIAADPRGEFLAAAGDDHVIRILRSSNFTIEKSLSGHRDVIRTLAFAPDGSKLVSAGNDGQLIVWDRSESFTVIQRMKGVPALARVRFSPDGSEMAAVGFDSEVFIISHRDRPRPEFNCDCKDLRAVAYREDNQIIVVAGRSGDLHLFDLKTGRQISDHALHTGRIHDVVFHRQSSTAVCVAEDGHVTVFDTDSARMVHRIPVTTGKLFTVALINNQTVAVAGSDNVIRIVDTDEGKVIRTLEGHRGSVSTLTASNDLLFSGGFDATLRRWSIADLGPDQERIAEKAPTVDRE